MAGRSRRGRSSRGRGYRGTRIRRVYRGGIRL